MLVIGLTGGIGSGKTTVAKLFAEHDIPIIDADELAHELTQPKQPAFLAIVQHFGQDILLENNLLDRKKLRHLIFDQSKERRWLENLLHPLIEKEIATRLAQLTSSPHPYCILVIPLLLEVTPYSFIDRILVVDTPRDLQIARVTSRDHVSASHIEAILKTQLSRAEKTARAHDIILNDGDLADLIPQVARLHKFYLSFSPSL